MAVGSPSVKCFGLLEQSVGTRAVGRERWCVEGGGCGLVCGRPWSCRWPVGADQPANDHVAEGEG